MTRVKRVTVVNQLGSSTMAVGMNGIVEIKDCCTEDDSGRINVCYIGKDANGDTLREIINCPVDVEWAAAKQD